MEDGIPELGLEDEYLIVIIRKNFPQYNLLTGFVGIKPMHDEVAAINDFYRATRGPPTSYCWPWSSAGS